MNEEKTREKTVLHFDVNKTVILTDAAGGKSLDDVLNGILADSTLGLIDRETRQWSISPDGDVNYYDFCKMTGHGKAERKRLCATFTDDGQPGASLRAVFSSMKDALVGPQSPRLRECGTPFELLPSFFTVFRHVLASFSPPHAPLAKTSTLVVFRTFGSDLVGGPRSRIATEIRAFLRGEHPLFPDIGNLFESARLDNAFVEKNTVFGLGDRSRFGVFARRAERVVLFMGTHDAKPDCLMDAHLSEGKDSLPNGVVAHDGVAAISRFLERSVGVLALRDHWDVWDASGERSSLGKLLPVFPHPSRVGRTSDIGIARNNIDSGDIDRSDINDNDIDGNDIDRSDLAATHHVFFDDNLSPLRKGTFADDEALIVDPRCGHSGKSIDPRELVGVHLIEVSPREALDDPFFFLRHWTSSYDQWSELKK